MPKKVGTEIFIVDGNETKSFQAVRLIFVSSLFGQMELLYIYHFLHHKKEILAQLKWI